MTQNVTTSPVISHHSNAFPEGYLPPLSATFSPPETGTFDAPRGYVRSMRILRPFSCGTFGSGGSVLIKSGTNVFGSSCANRTR